MSLRAIRASRSDAGITTPLLMLKDSDLAVGEVRSGSIIGHSTIRTA